MSPVILVLIQSFKLGESSKSIQSLKIFLIIAFQILF